ncbi:MAG: hypothetical protein FWC79_03120 [Oscillospiraceae bacterium]|nr:hypothetical protein [Oscillospiraceae bacterium]
MNEIGEDVMPGVNEEQEEQKKIMVLEEEVRLAIEDAINKGIEAGEGTVILGHDASRATLEINIKANDDGDLEITVGNLLVDTVKRDESVEHIKAKIYEGLEKFAEASDFIPSKVVPLEQQSNRVGEKIPEQAAGMEDKDKKLEEPEEEIVEEGEKESEKEDDDLNRDDDSGEAAIGTNNRAVKLDLDEKIAGDMTLREAMKLANMDNPDKYLYVIVVKEGDGFQLFAEEKSQKHKMIGYDAGGHKTVNFDKYKDKVELITGGDNIRTAMIEEIEKSLLAELNERQPNEAPGQHARDAKNYAPELFRLIFVEGNETKMARQIAGIDEMPKKAEINNDMDRDDGRRQRVDPRRG